MLPKLSDATQSISFSEGDGVCSAEVFATDVVLSTNAGNHDHGSSKVKLKNLVDYNWEPKFYSGQLLAIHLSGKYLAYCIKAPNAVNPGTWTGMVRVVYNPEPATDKRALIKGMKGEVQDLAFAHIQNQVILACIDEQGNFYVHEIEVTDSGLRCTLLAEVRDDEGVAGVGHRVVWCPYIPDEDDDTPDDDVAKLLLTTHGNVARMWSMALVVSAVSGTGGVGRAGALARVGAVRAAHGHAAPLVAAAFSPDGTALATAAADGYVMFFQVYMHNDSSPRCLHKWQPHGGKPLSCLFFLDNHNNYNTDVQFWKFAVTGADNNTSIKVWSCKSWSCMQSITFTPSPGVDSLGLNAMLDRSATYLLLSDFKSRSLYVLHMARDPEDTMAYCKSISEFLLPYPVLSFCIVDAEEQQPKCESSCDDPFHRNGSGDDATESPDHFEGAAGAEARVVLRLYIVQPKGLQHGTLVYAPSAWPPHGEPAADLDLALEDKLPSPAESPALAASILQQQSQQLKNLLLRAQPAAGGLLESPTAAPQLNLMTPDAFSSPGKRDDEDPPLASTPDVGVKSRSSTSGICEEVIATKLTSGGSSPSREVQQIMGHNSDFYKEEACEEPVVVEPEVVAANGADVIYGDDMFDGTDDDVSQKINTGSETSWPQISLAQINSANQRAASSAASCQSPRAASPAGGGGLPPPPPVPPALPPALPPAPPVLPALALDRTKFESLEHKLDKLTELVEAQSRELRRMRARSPRVVVEEALAAHAQRTAEAVDNALVAGWERVAAAGAAAGEAAGARAAAAAGAGAARALEPLARALHHELAAKLTATDALLRDNIDKLANSKSVTDRLSSSIAKSVSEMVKESFRAALFDSVVPVMEKAHAQIFKQINHAFQTGTKEFAAHTEAAARAAAARGGAGPPGGSQRERARLVRALSRARFQRCASDDTVLGINEATGSHLLAEIPTFAGGSWRPVLHQRPSLSRQFSSPPATVNSSKWRRDVRRAVSADESNATLQREASILRRLLRPRTHRTLTRWTPHPLRRLISAESDTRNDDTTLNNGVGVTDENAVESAYNSLTSNGGDTMSTVITEQPPAPREENEEAIISEFSLWWEYAKACGWWGAAYWFAAACAQAFVVGADSWLAKLSVQVPDDAPVDTTWSLVQAYMCWCAASAVASWCAGCACAAGGARARRRLHERALHAALHATAQHYRATPPGHTLHRFAADVQVVDKKLPTAISRWGQLVLVCVAALLVSAVMAPWSILVLLPAVLCYFTLQSIYLSNARAFQRAEGHSAASVVSLCAETCTGAATVRAGRLQSRMRAAFFQRLDSNHNTLLLINAANRWLGLSLDLVGAVSVCVSLGVALSGGSVAAAGLAGTYSLLLPAYLAHLAKCRADLDQQLALERLHTDTNIPQEDYREDCPLPSNWQRDGKLEFENVSVQLESGSTCVLNNINISIAPGEKVAICGRSGSGKSTLVLSCVGATTIASGRILLDGQELRSVPLRTLRHRVVVMPQDPVLFSGTLRENLDPLAVHTDEEIWHCLKAVSLFDFVSAQPAGLECVVGGGGGGWSVGRCARAGAARAALHARAAAVLVLDEPAAALDAHHERALLAALAAVAPNTTLLTVAHRVSSVRGYDRAVVLEEGRVAECGAVSTLLSQPASRLARMLAAANRLH